MNKITYKEFEEIVNDMGCQVSFEETVVFVEKGNIYDPDHVVADISRTSVGVFSVFRSLTLNEEEIIKIGKECWRLASTPLKDRKEYELKNNKESKKYYLKVKSRYNHLFPGGETYIGRHRQDDYILVSDKGENLHFQTKFTARECEALEKRYDLTILERVEVEDE